MKMKEEDCLLNNSSKERIGFEPGKYNTDAFNVAKITINNMEIEIPIGLVIYDALNENVEKITPLLEFDIFLKKIFPIKKQKANVIIGGAIIEFEAEKYQLNEILDRYTAIPETKMHLLLEFDDLLRLALPVNKRPPTHKQVTYAAEIAMVLDVNLPQKVTINSNACSLFIEDNIDEFKVAYLMRRELTRESNRVARWVVAFSLFEKGVDLKNIALKLGVAREPTIEKYLVNYSEWKNEFDQKDHSHKITVANMIMSILELEYYECGPFDIDLID